MSTGHLQIHSRRQYSVPTYVVEFLRGRYCASVEPDEIAVGLDIVKGQLKGYTAHPGEREVFKSRPGEQDFVRLIDIVRGRLDAKNDCYVAELPSLGLRDVHRAGLREGRQTGAGILRWKPSISWKKDSRKQPEEPRRRDDFPWLRGCPGDGNERQRIDFRAEPEPRFDGSHWNDLHYTNSAKRQERQRHARSGTGTG